MLTGQSGLMVRGKKYRQHPKIRSGPLPTAGLYCISIPRSATLGRLRRPESSPLLVQTRTSACETRGLGWWQRLGLGRLLRSDSIDTNGTVDRIGSSIHCGE